MNGTGPELANTGARESINIDTANEKINRLIQSLCETSTLIDAMIDRLDGPSPKAERETLPDIPPGQLSQLHFLLGVATREYREMHERIERLNGLL